MIDDKALIHPTAIISDNVSIGPYSVIGENVEIGEDCIIGPHVVIQGPTKIGKGNQIFQFASIGDAPQDKKFKGEKTTLEIGDNNIFRECVTVNRGTIQGGGLTKLGSNNLMMAYSHIAHDCIVGDDNIFANNASLAGHVLMDNHITIGAFCAIHQFCRVGSYSFVSRAAMVVKDVPAYLMIAGHDPKPAGINTVGLERHGFTSEQILKIKRGYKIIYRKSLTSLEAVSELEAGIQENPEWQLLIDSLNLASRGIVR